MTVKKAPTAKKKKLVASKKPAAKKKAAKTILDFAGIWKDDEDILDAFREIGVLPKKRKKVG